MPEKPAKCTDCGGEKFSEFALARVRTDGVVIVDGKPRRPEGAPQNVIADSADPDHAYFRCTACEATFKLDGRRGIYKFVFG